MVTEQHRPHIGDPAIDLLNEAIAISGLGVTRYAEICLLRSPSCVHKWRRGQTPIPQVIRRMLSPQPLIEPEPVREEVTHG